MSQLDITTSSLDMLEDSSSDRSRRKNQNTFSWSSTSSSFSSSTLLTSTHELDIEEEEEDMMYSYLILLSEFNQLNSVEVKEKRISEILCRAASHGDMQTIQHIMMNNRLRPYLNLDLTDDQGSTPLIYASCFGKLEVVKYLLQIGAKVDVQDKIGWTALIWATTNNHEKIVQVLLDYSASYDHKSFSGRSIYDLADIENENIISILNPLFNQQLQKRKATNKRQHLDSDDDDEELIDYEASVRSVNKFNWDHCLLDQMFVFGEDELDHILDITISELKLPMKSRSEIYVPVNIIFLSARYAHYFTSREILNQLLSKSVQRIAHVVKTNVNDIHTLAFWIANLSQLLYYLKKDAGLVVATAEHQLEISELISETYTLLVMDFEKRLDRILEPSILEFEQIDGLESIDFQDDWHRFFRRNRASMTSPSSPNRKSFGVDQIRSTLSPQSITSLLTSVLCVFQSYDVHPVIVIQAIAQIFHFLSCELFNRILSNKKYLCRSRALQIRMNLTVIEEWIREHHLPITLTAYFNPVIQLVQLLQCVSQLQDLMDFITTAKSFDLLNPMQIKRLVLNYRYEVSETRLPEEIEKYTMQIAEDTIKLQEDYKQSMESRNSRPNSISSLGSLLLYSMSQKKLPNKGTDEEDDMEESNREWVVEKKDSKYMLPFSLPTTTNMVHSGWNSSSQQLDNAAMDKMSLSDKIYFELKQKLMAEREKNVRERSIIPSIPEEWLEKLDHHTGHY